jgi:hypothetical protein
MTTTRSGRPILVTGVPRSGTTWLARLLATAPGTVLAGREPMNPRGRQYALAGTLDGWVRLDSLTSRQRRALRSAYTGLNPWVYSRYGRRQWAGPLPRSRLIMKDPFALLSLSCVTEATGALPVMVYRHPGAVLVSYRRMGWRPDLEELQQLVTQLRATEVLDLDDLPAPGQTSPAEEMGRFWATLHEIALLGADRLAGLTIVSHEELAGSGESGGRRLLAELGLLWGDGAEAELSREASPRPPQGDHGLHRFDRPPAAVAGAWRSELAADELARIEQVTETLRGELERRRLPLT